MKQKTENGFTTMELAAVLLIFGMVMTILLGALTAYNEQKDVQLTKDALALSEAALFEFKARNGYYPCPADPEPTLGTADPNYGRANCARSALAFGRDADNDGMADEILIGAVPFATLLDPDGDPLTNDGITNVSLNAGKTVDGWGRKLTYAVSSKLIDRNTYSDLYGAIEIIDENNHSVLQTPGSAHLTVVSHGKNGRGARMPDGALVENCTNTIEEEDGDGSPNPGGGKYKDYLDSLLSLLPGFNPNPDIGNNGPGNIDPALNDGGVAINPGDVNNNNLNIDNSGRPALQPARPPAPGGEDVAEIDPDISTGPDEVENCDNDGSFLAGLYTEGRDFNDDMVRYMGNINSTLWQYSGSDQRIVNTNPGNVGVGVHDPREQLHIGGNLQTTRVKAEVYCSEEGVAGGLCITASVLGGNDPDMRCQGQNQIAVSIQDNRVVCATAFMHPQQAQAGDAEREPQVMLCPPGQVVSRISNTRGVICMDAPIPEP